MLYLGLTFVLAQWHGVFLFALGAGNIERVRRHLTVSDAERKPSRKLTKARLLAGNGSIDLIGSDDSARDGAPAVDASYGGWEWATAPVWEASHRCCRSKTTFGQWAERAVDYLLLIEMLNEPQSSRLGGVLGLLLGCKQWQQGWHPIEQRFLVIVVKDSKRSPPLAVHFLRAGL